MLQSIKQLYGHKLGASDGDIGHVKDFYFDDQNWAVRYVVADTGAWLPGRLVLLSPHAFGTLHLAGSLLLANLTRKQIEDSPPIESHKPVSRQYEEEYHRYYGWPYYWQGSGLWGLSGFPMLGLLPEIHRPDELDTLEQPEPADAHLRSTQAANGYHVQAHNGPVGHVHDFMIDTQSWAICEVVIKTGHWLSGRDLHLPTGTVERISYDDSTFFVNSTREAIDGHTPAAGSPL